ncbi:hypothetical protein DDQ41_16520 [Streptomyces spongiicola]|uniref:Uncharacterized protein n=1 Tax=Streptomyces spongiicola TaxID=1690221 RepID=A0ABM6V7U3_9ACTN|nr:hypothetical protein DDQ41_16520 [Streptomyces spongiicola]
MPPLPAFPLLSPLSRVSLLSGCLTFLAFLAFLAVLTSLWSSHAATGPHPSVPAGRFPCGVRGAGCGVRGAGCGVRWRPRPGGGACDHPRRGRRSGDRGGVGMRSAGSALWVARSSRFN